ncbi:zinc-ribbon domain-containing protein [Massilimicrobiota timonensis]|uniref:zinc-ribbon domain-containing protein n=1 Tax=Massilimicrobiota timonensis TaxID=1776392 RepID=UPI00101DACE9|nr:zinc ribbon domain-containing protein [Massilimicrobiota timonensis]
MFCKNCGQEIDDKAVVCPHCGVAQREMSYDTIKDDGGVGWGILGCCIPVVGLILWLVWKDTKPQTAKAAGIGALVSVGLAALWYIFVFALGIGGAMMF